MSEQLVSELLIDSYYDGDSFLWSFFNFICLFSLYLIQYDLLNKKKWGKLLWRIADLSKLDHMSYVLNVIGVPMLMLSLILGIQWACIKVPDLPWYDAKVIGSIFVVGCL